MRKRPLSVLEITLSGGFWGAVFAFLLYFPGISAIDDFISYTGLTLAQWCIGCGVAVAAVSLVFSLQRRNKTERKSNVTESKRSAMTEQEKKKRTAEERAERQRTLDKSDLEDLRARVPKLLKGVASGPPGDTEVAEHHLRENAAVLFWDETDAGKRVLAEYSKELKLAEAELRRYELIKDRVPGDWPEVEELYSEAGGVQTGDLSVLDKSAGKIFQGLIDLEDRAHKIPHFATIYQQRIAQREARMAQREASEKLDRLQESHSKELEALREENRDIAVAMAKFADGMNEDLSRSVDEISDDLKEIAEWVEERKH